MKPLKETMQKLTDRQNRILKWLKKNPGYYGPTEIGKKLKLHIQENIAAAIVSSSMDRLLKLGYVERVDPGHYCLIQK